MYSLLILFVLIIILIIVILMVKFPGMFIAKKRVKRERLPHVIQKYDLYNKKETKLINETVQKIKSQKTYRNCVMSTIGTPFYIDGFNSDKYKNSKNYYNEILDKEFDWMYKKLIKKLTKIKNKKCEYYQETSLPGFHIFKAKSWLGSGWSVASLHVDRQYSFLKDSDGFDKSDVFSFTIGIKMPKDSGLYYYDLTSDDINLRFPLAYNFIGKQIYKIDYDPGKLYIHDGLHFHMISEFNSINESDERITLQGHGIYNHKTNSYIIYW